MQNFEQKFNIKALQTTKKEILLLTPEQTKAKQEMIEFLSEGQIDSAVDIYDKFTWSEEIIKSQEVQNAAKQGMIKWFSEGLSNIALEINKKFVKSEEIMQDAAKQGMAKLLLRGLVNTAIRVSKETSLSDKIVQDITKQGMIQCLSQGLQDSAVRIYDQFVWSEEIIKSPEVQNAAKQGIIDLLSKSLIDSAIVINEKFVWSEEIIKSPEVQNAAKQGIIDLLSKSLIDSAIVINEKFVWSEEIIKSPEVQNAAKQGMVVCLSANFIDTAIKIHQNFVKSEEITQAAVKQGMVKLLLRNKFDNIVTINEKFVKSEEIMQAAAKQAMIELLIQGNLNFAFEIHEKFIQSEEFIKSPVAQDVLKEGLIATLSKDLIDESGQIIELILNQQSVLDVLQLLTQDENWLTAHKLLSIIEESGYAIKNDNLKELITQKAKEENNKRDHPQVRREIYWEKNEPIKLNQELILFYINQMIIRDMQIFEIQLNPNLPGTEEQEISFQNQVALVELKRSISKEIKFFFEWSRQYLIKAICGELSFVNCLPNNQSEVFVPDLEKWLNKATEEEIRIFLYQAKCHFLNPEWQGSYGGVLWMQIADAAYDAWRSLRQDNQEKEMSMKIDHIVDLEHNSGLVFDKDPLVQFDPHREKKILDKKAKSKNLNELFELFKAEIKLGTPEEFFIEKIKDRVNLWQKLQSSPTKARGYD